MKMTAFWDTASCSLVEVDRRFREVLNASIIIIIIKKYFAKICFPLGPTGKKNLLFAQ
jgi:hypothetical protein